MPESARKLATDPGPGFCYSRESGFCRQESGFGPLLVTFDSNIVIDLEEHGLSILDQVPANVDPRAQQQLDALSELLEIWRTRDIRFIALPQLISDFKRKPPSDTVARRQHSRARIIDALSFQLYDGDIRELIDELTASCRPVDRQQLGLTDVSTGELKSLDAQLLREALACEVDVFLTNDKQLRSAARRINLPLNVLSPAELIELFASSHVGILGEEHAYHEDCYANFDLPCDDIGKWSPLMEILEGRDPDNRG